MNAKSFVLAGVFIFGFSIFINASHASAKSGCCSWHGGVSGCDYNIGRQVCNDGTYSPTCTCTYSPSYSQPSYNQPTYIPVQTKPEYDYEWVSQSNYPTISKGGKATLELKIRNTGTAWWYNNGLGEIRLGTSNPQDRNSGFYVAGNWISTNRAVKMKEDKVVPGEVATFTFEIIGNTPSGTYPEYFKPVAEGKTWLPDKGIYWNISVN